MDVGIGASQLLGSRHDLTVAKHRFKDAIERNTQGRASAVRLLHHIRLSYEFLWGPSSRRSDPEIVVPSNMGFVRPLGFPDGELEGCGLSSTIEPPLVFAFAVSNKILAKARAMLELFSLACPVVGSAGVTL